MRKAKQVNTNNNKCHTININNLDPSLLDIKKKSPGGENVFYKKNYCKFGINTEDSLPLKESLKFLTVIGNINLVLQVDNESYPEIYLDECFYELSILYKKSDIR